MSTPPTVLFVCHHNANRSQIAAAYLADLACEAVRVQSAGPQPSEKLNPLAVEVMAEEGLDISDATPVQLTQAMLEEADRVVTLGCAEAVDLPPTVPHEDWTISSGDGSEKYAARAIRDELKMRVHRLYATLT